VIIGVRPEHFEDAAVEKEAHPDRMRFKTKIDVVESMGSELYAHFTVTTDESIESAELRELAEDAGGGEIPMEGEEGRIVARLDPASGVEVGKDAELWVDASRLHLFDPEDGKNLTVGGQQAGAKPERPTREEEAPAAEPEAG
jgi:multiple sugar transport system ATP-binding protein